MPVPSNRYSLRLLIHVLVLSGLLLLLFQPLTWSVVLPTEFWVRQGILFCLWVILFYVNSEVMVPKLLFGKKTIQFGVWILCSIILSVVLIRTIEVWLNLPLLMHQAIHPGAPISSGNIRPRFDIVMLLTTMLVLGISTSVTTIIKWQKDAEIRQSLEQQKVSSELSFLKAQINPHFFFNTLHSIYALTSINIEKAREALYTLSHMMRYVIYETPSGTTSINKEIAFIEDYIKLMKLRLTDKVRVSFEYPETLSDISVAPMLLVPFIENAFKHGVSTLHPSYIHIRILQEKKKIDVEVRNSLFSEKRTVLEESSGIGLSNTWRRLELLYPNRFNLVVNGTENEFKVQLNLDLS